MTQIERKAMELVNEVARSRGQVTWDCIDREFCLEEALCRAIEQHEAFRQEVSDAVEAWRLNPIWNTSKLRKFIITKPDPLVEAIQFATGIPKDACDAAAKDLRAALAKRGLEIREKSDVG